MKVLTIALIVWLVGMPFAGWVAFVYQDTWHANPLLVAVAWPFILLWVLAWKVIDLFWR